MGFKGHPLMADTIFKQLGNYQGGIQNRRRSRFGLPENAFFSGKNVEVSDGGLVTRPGYTEIGQVQGAAGTALILDFETAGTSAAYGNNYRYALTDGAAWHTPYYLAPSAAGVPVSGTYKYNGSYGLQIANMTEEGWAPGLVYVADSPHWQLSAGIDDLRAKIYAYVYLPALPTGAQVGSFYIANQRIPAADLLEDPWFAPTPPTWFFRLNSTAGASSLEFEVCLTDIEAPDESVTGTFTLTAATWWRVQLEVKGLEVTLKADPAASWVDGTVLATHTMGQAFPSCSQVLATGYRTVSITQSTVSAYMDLLTIINATGYSEVNRLQQVRFPTNESDYLLAQSKQTGRIFASTTALPSASLTFEQLAEFTLEGDTGQVSIAALNDKAIITEGVSDVPQVFQGCLEADGTDWPGPLRCLVSRDGLTYDDVGNQVSDKDPDTVADVGGIAPLGSLLIGADLPLLDGIKITVETANTGVGAAPTEKTLTLDADADIEREDLKGSITAWDKEATAKGYFDADPDEFVEVGQQIVFEDTAEVIIIDLPTAKIMAGAAVNLGGSPNTVKIPCSGHEFVEDDIVKITNTTNYNGTHTLPSQASGNADNFVIESAYTAETFASPDQALKAVEISADHATGNISHIYGLEVDADLGVTMAVSLDVLSPVIEKTLAGGIPGRKSIRQIIPATGGDVSQTVRLTLQSASRAPYGWGYAAYASIMEQDSGADGAETPTRFRWSGSGYSHDYLARVSHNAPAWSDVLSYTYDPTVPHIVVIDLMYYLRGGGTPEMWVGGQSGSYIMTPVTNDTGTEGYYYKDEATSVTLQTVTGFTHITGQYAAVCKVEIAGRGTLQNEQRVAYVSDTGGYVDISTAASLVSLSADQVADGDATVYHALSWDLRTTWCIHNGTAWRDIARDNSGMWQSKDAGGAWQNATEDSQLGALRQAFAVTENQMDLTAMEAITAAQFADKFEPIQMTRLYFACALQADGTNLPSVHEYIVTTYDEGDNVVEVLKAATGWTEVANTDGTNVGGVPVAQTGIVEFTNTSTADWMVVNNMPGYWWRLRWSNGLAAGTEITRIQLSQPCQPLANIGGVEAGWPSVAMAFLYYDASEELYRDFSTEVADGSESDIMSAWLCLDEDETSPIPMTSSDKLYIAGARQYSAVLISPHRIKNNRNASTMTVKYFNGTAMVALDVLDGTAAGSNTLAQQGLVSFTIPPDWHMCSIREGDVSGYYLEITVSATLTLTGIAECRLYEQPSDLTKHKYAIAAKDRVLLGCRTDAPNQVDVSASSAEFSWPEGIKDPITADTWAARTGGPDGIIALVESHDRAFIIKPERWYSIAGSSPTDFQLAQIETGRQSPVNQDVIIVAPVGGRSEWGRQGIFFLSRFGATVVTGLQADSAYSSGEAQSLSDNVAWWEDDAVPRIEKAYLHMACGVYWPAKSWLMWSVPMRLAENDPTQITNNVIIRYDLANKCWLPMYEYDVGISAMCTAYEDAPTAPGRMGQLELLAGTYTGQILRLLTGTTDNGTIIAWSALTGFIDLGSPHVVKESVTATLVGTADNDVQLSIFCQGRGTAHEKLYSKVKEARLPNYDYKRLRLPDSRWWQFQLDGTGPAQIETMILEGTGIREDDKA